jgi:DNA modification methylase
MVKARSRRSRKVDAGLAFEKPASMVEVTAKDLFEFRAKHHSVQIESVQVALEGPWTLKAVSPPADYRPEKTTVWSFPDRGDWATHSGNYRGNWSPYIPRNLILRYTRPRELVLDQMMGSGTTLVEAKLLGRDAIGVDVNPHAVMVARDRLDFQFMSLDSTYVHPSIKTYTGDARNLNLIPDDSVDLVATHPPYAGIVAYTQDRIPGDLSSLRRIDDFVNEMFKVARESYRVLKPGKHCAILMGDTRRHRHFIPISTRVMQAFLEVGFVLREDITKIQWKMKSTRENWSGSKYDFLLLAHEHLFVFRKLGNEESRSPFKDSAKWWASPAATP